MKYPEFLKNNGKIGFVAPSFGCATEPYHSAFINSLDKFKSMGFSYELGPNCYAGEGIGISNSPIKCGEEFNDFFAKEEVEALISCGGGELMCEILEFIDFEKIKAGKPKWFLGYSDNTNITFLLTTLCDIASIYGPCAPSFGMEPWHKSLFDTLDLLTGQKRNVTGYDKWELESNRTETAPLEPYNVTNPLKLMVFPGRETTVNVKGRLLGGCVDCLSVLVGTCFDKVEEFALKYKEDGIIWFMEACDLDPFSLRRDLWQMEKSGWFHYVKAFVFGRPGHFGEEVMGMDFYQAVTGITNKYNVPVIMDADIGHLPPMMPIITGSLGTLKVENNQISIDMSLE